jgi:hypothetical protein
VRGNWVIRSSVSRNSDSETYRTPSPHKSSNILKKLICVCGDRGVLETVLENKEEEEHVMFFFFQCDMRHGTLWGGEVVRALLFLDFIPQTN